MSPSTGPHLFAVVNAQASGTDDEGQLATTLARLGNAGARAKGMATSSPEELEHALETTAGRRVVLVGGDGSLHAVANLSGELPEFALLPRGRANNVARALGIPVDRDAAARMAVQGEVALGALHPRLRWPALAFAVLVAASRPYLGVHFWVDVLVGAGVGALLALAIVALLRSILTHHARESLRAPRLPAVGRVHG